MAKRAERSKRAATAKLHAQKQRTRWSLQQKLLQKGNRLYFSQAIPESSCECCATGIPIKDTAEDTFDENGYPLVKKTAHASFANPIAGEGLSTQTDALLPLTKERSSKPFPFLDLPAELRTYIYELAFSHEKQIVCVNDRLLRPCLGMSNPENILRMCKHDLICAPCQLHHALQTGNYALSSVCKQLHAETAPIPYQVNFFSVHNLYYLQAFLTVIGKPARKAVRKLRFDWKFPESEERHSLHLAVDLNKCYTLLLECENLHTLWIDMDVVNLFTWLENGERQIKMKHDMSQLKGIHIMYGLRELKEIRVRWKNLNGLTMEPWVKAMMGLWSGPRGSDGSNSQPVDAEMTMDENNEWCCIHWKRE